jgi:hypothetical protein
MVVGYTLLELAYMSVNTEEDVVEAAELYKEIVKLAVGAVDK